MTVLSFLLLTFGHKLCLSCLGRPPPALVAGAWHDKGPSRGRWRRADEQSDSGQKAPPGVSASGTNATLAADAEQKQCVAALSR